MIIRMNFMNGINMKSKSVCIAFLGNALNDTRVSNLAASLIAQGNQVNVISFDWTTPDFQTITGNTTVYKLDKTGSSIKYYLKFLRLLSKSLSKMNSDIFVAEDVYTLPVVTFYAKLKRKRVYYNCRELYPFLAGLRNKKIVQNIIRTVERFFIRKVDLVLTTGEMDAQFIEQYYKITNVVVLRNLPRNYTPNAEINIKAKLSIPENSRILLYQGVLLEGRGLAKSIKAIKNISNAHLVILGEGVERNNLEKLAAELEISGRVHFLGTINQSELVNYTVEADIGLSLIENISLSYYYALPNKLFEYIASAVPVICSDMPQMKLIIDKYKVGKCISLDSGECLESKIRQMIDDQDLLREYSENAKEASKELNWDVEFEKVKSYFPA